MSEQQGVIERMAAQINRVNTELVLLSNALKDAGLFSAETVAKLNSIRAGGDDDFDNEFEKAKTSGAAVTGDGTGTPTAEVDAEGVPWDERIHAKTKTKTAKGVWKKAKGLADGLYEKITAELKASANTAPAAANTPPGMPAAPGAAATTPTGMPAAPGADDTKSKLMATIVVISDEYGVSYERVLKVLQDRFGAKSMDELPAEKFAEASAVMDEWVAKLQAADDDIEQIVSMGGDNAKQGVAQVLAASGVNGINELDVDNFDEVIDKLTTYRQQWADYVASQQQ